MLFVFHFAPGMAYKFSPEKGIPSKSQRINKTSNTLDEFVILPELSDNMPCMDSINIVLKGASFNKDQLSKLSGPTFVINWWEKVEGDNIIYTTGGATNVPQYTEKGLYPILCVDQVLLDEHGIVQGYHKTWPDPVPASTPELEAVFKDPKNTRLFCAHRINAVEQSTGSGLISIIALCKYAKEVNIYGWDHYIKFEPAKSNYWKLLLGLLAFEGSKAQPDVVEMALYGWNYCHRINQLPFVNVHSYLGQLDHHPKMVRKLERIFYDG